MLLGSIYRIYIITVNKFGCTNLKTKHLEKKREDNYKRMLSAVLIPGRSTLQNSSCTATYFPSHKRSKQDFLGTVGETRTNSWETFSYRLLHMDIPILVLHSHTHEYGHVRNGWNGHRMFITIEQESQNSKTRNDFLFRYKTFLLTLS